LAKKTPASSRKVLLSVVTPAFNESKNLPLLYARLKKSLDKLRLPWEWIVVDDHSADETYPVMEKIARKDKRVKALRFAKNSGSHLALACALGQAKGQCAVGMAADLQDPPETIGELYEKWKDGAKVVWAVRAKREGESLGTLFFARLYYFIVRYGLGMRQMPPSGADFFLLDRVVIQRLSQARVRNASILLLICSFGFRQDYITYTKRKRAHGKSGWTLKKKLKLFLDSVTMFSMAPVWWGFGSGIAFFMVGLILATKGDLWGKGFLYLGMALSVLGLFLTLFVLRLIARLGAAPAGPLFTVEKSIGVDKKPLKS
jgi:glycosyltransferase involved in cell wall biosynthesis